MKLFSFIVFVTCIPFMGCVNTEGTLDIKGKVLDENTRDLLPRRTIIVQGLVGGYNESTPVYAGQFATDSSGYFTYTIRKVKNAYFYNFCLVCDSAYACSTIKLGLGEIERDAKFLSFTLSKLTDLTITVERKTKIPVQDTLFLTWRSNEIVGEDLYPADIENFGIPPDSRYRWIGGNVKSVIRTKAYADKNSIVCFQVFRNGKIKEITDTIFCKRGFANVFNFKY